MPVVLSRLILTWWFVLAGLWAPSALAQDGAVPPMPKDMSQVDVFLLTVGRGPQIEALFGHTILRVVDRAGGQDLAFNWGIFDFVDPLFIWNFYRGHLTYMLGIYATPTLIDFYRNVEQRSIIQQRLVLTLKQKTALMQRLIRNALPANVRYQYSQLRDNCATRPRDHLDAVLGSQLSRAYQDRPAAVTYRQHMKAASRPVWWVEMGLDMLTNDVLDRQLSQWQEMFLPERLQQLLAQLPAYDDAGKALPGQTLLTDPTWLIDLPEPMPGPDPYAMWMLLAAIPCGLPLVLLWQRRHSRSRMGWFGAVSLLYGFWSALWGTLFAGNWLFSSYLETAHNGLLWLMWPVDWIFVYYGIRLIIRRSLPSSESLLTRLVQGLSLGHLVAAAAATVLWLTGIIHQNILPMLASYGVFAALFFVTVYCQGAAQGSRSADAE